MSPNCACPDILAPFRHSTQGTAFKPVAAVTPVAGTQPNAGTTAQSRGFAVYPQSPRPK